MSNKQFSLPEVMVLAGSVLAGGMLAAGTYYLHSNSDVTVICSPSNEQFSAQKTFSFHKDGGEKSLFISHNRLARSSFYVLESKGTTERGTVKDEDASFLMKQIIEAGDKVCENSLKKPSLSTRAHAFSAKQRMSIRLTKALFNTGKEQKNGSPNPALDVFTTTPSKKPKTVEEPNTPNGKTILPIMRASL